MNWFSCVIRLVFCMSLHEILKCFFVFLQCSNGIENGRSSKKESWFTKHGQMNLFIAINFERLNQMLVYLTFAFTSHHCFNYSFLLFIIKFNVYDQDHPNCSQSFQFCESVRFDSKPSNEFDVPHIHYPIWCEISIQIFKMRALQWQSRKKKNVF